MIGGLGVADPYPVLAELRAREPMTYDEASGMWLALSHRHANQVLRDRRLGRIWADREPARRFAAFNALHRHQMMENEPPDHTRLRAQVAAAFSRGHIERLRPRIGALAEELLAVAGTELDLIADYAEPLPVQVIAELLGVPPADRPLLRPWSAAIVRMYELRRGTPTEQAATEDGAVQAAADFAAYLRELAAARRVRPGTDLISDLLARGGLSEDELVASAALLLNAGHEASVNALGNGVVALLRHPAELARLRAASPGGALRSSGPASSTALDRATILDRAAVLDSAVEEMLRYDAPLQLFERTATADVEIGGVVVPAGRTVAALLGAANRDPAVFAEPDRFDAGRGPNPHLGFGAGLHFCLGAPLARLELRTALATLLRRSPGLALAGEPVRRTTFVLRGYASVPIRR
ncbi:MAG TPA: cytochrome P450 [Mycobacteriales bacterium]|nr:cytochrome P450 [Mycobacteriales bacterium]